MVLNTTATPRNESETQDRAYMVVNGKHLRPRWTLANYLVISDSETEEKDSIFVVDSTAEAEEASDYDNHQIGANQALLQKSTKKVRLCVATLKMLASSWQSRMLPM